MRIIRHNLCALAASVAVLAGCGGSGGAGGSSLVGKPAIRAITISGFQSQVAATKYVLPLLMAGAPAGSGLHGPGATQPRSPKSRVLAFDTDLNLYYSTGTSGPTWTISFFTDAAGTISAGSASVTIEGATTFDTNYLVYPAKLDLAENITAGNLVSHGTGTLTFTDSSGSNTLTGVLDAPPKGIHAVLDMSLDASGNVGGSITVVQNGLTAVVTGLSGALTSSFSGNAAVTPGNLTGTATINLLQGTYQLNIDDPSGLQSQGTVDASRNLVIDYNDGTSLTLSDVINQPVRGPGSNGGGGSSPYTIAPVSGNPWEINGVSPDGRMVGQIGTFLSSIPYYWASPTATPQAVTLDPTLTNITATGVNASGHIVGYGLDSTTDLPVALYWAAFNLAPVRLTSPTSDLVSFNTPSVFLQSSDRIVVTYPIHAFPTKASYVFSGPTDTSPYPVMGGYVTQMSDGSAALGLDSTNATYVVWPSLSPSATPIPVPTTGGTTIQTVHIGADGTIAVAGLNNTAWIVPGPNYTTTTNLTPPSGHPAIGVYGLGPTGHVLGFGMTDAQPVDNEGLLWMNPASAPVNLRSNSTPNVVGAFYETSSGILIVNVLENSSGPTFHLSVMTPR